MTAAGATARTRRPSATSATKKVLQPASAEPRNHRLDAAAIGVRLDHGGAFDRQRHAGELLPVGLDGGKVDGEHAAGLDLGRPRRLGRSGRHGVDGFKVGIVDGHGPPLWRAFADPSSV